MSVIWGIPYLFIRIAVGELSPPTLVFFRTAFSAAIFLPFVFARGGFRAVGGKWIPLVVFAAVEIALPWLFLSSAEQHISSALAGLLISAVPLVAVVITTALGSREHLNPTTLSGLAIGVLGVALIVGLDLHASEPIALLEMGGVVVGYALGPVILSRYLTSIPSVAVNGFALAMTAIVYSPLAALNWPHAVPGAAVIASVAVLVLVCTVLALMLFIALIGEIGPVRALVITYVNPAVAAILGVAVLGESLTWAMGLGFALVVAGSVLATRRRAAPEGPSRAPEAQPGQAV